MHRARPTGRFTLARIGLLLVVVLAVAGPVILRPDTGHAQPPTVAPSTTDASLSVVPPRATATRTVPTALTVSSRAVVTGIRLRHGDTLWKLSRRHHTTVIRLQQLNHLGPSTLVYAGRLLLVPVGPTEAAAETTGTTPAGVQRVLAYARAQLGKPYVFGATGPNTFDCSGLVLRAWQVAGVHLPRTTSQQIHAGTRTTRAGLRPGDLVFTNHVGHVELYLGDGRVIYAPHTGAVVKTGPLPPAGQADAYIHIALSTSAVNSATWASPGN